MLRNLIISNYALIRSLDLEFGPGLTIITGETGAGKSIMLGALGLVMGGRADTKMISDDGSKSVVTAQFVDVDEELRPLLEEKGIELPEDGSELTIRREISATGRSKVFVNDTPVTLQTLSQIVPRLIDIHSQHANAKINEPAERLRIIDAMAANEELRHEYGLLFNDYKELRHQIAKRKETAEKEAHDIEFMRFQLEQLDKLAPKKGELAEIEKRFEVLSDADGIKENLSAIYQMFGDGFGSLQAILLDSSAIADHIPGCDLAARIREMLVEAKDIQRTVEDMDSKIDTDPATLARLSDRMTLYYDTVKRFRVKEADELADLHADLRERVARVTLGDELLPEMEKEARRLALELKQSADRLTESRVKAAAKFSERLMQTASPLGLPHINFVAEVSPRKLNANGQDEIEFLCSFNKNGKLRPVAEIASGGETARMMLSLKSILAGHINLPTIIFDEVDTGVSGEIADKMGEMMRDVAKDMQVIVITHLPQVAAKGNEHFKVYKKDGDNRTETHVLKLTMDERISEIASMISGSEVSEAALQAARDLLKIEDK